MATILLRYRFPCYEGNCWWCILQSRRCLHLNWSSDPVAKCSGYVMEPALTPWTIRSGSVWRCSGTPPRFRRQMFGAPVLKMFGFRRGPCGPVLVPLEMFYILREMLSTTHLHLSANARQLLLQVRKLVVIVCLCHTKILVSRDAGDPAE